MSFFSGVTFVLVCFVFAFMLSLKPRLFVQSFFVLRYACVPTATHISSLFLGGGMSLFPCIHYRFSLYMESASPVFCFRMMVFIYVVTRSWIFDTSLCENSTNQKMVIHYPGQSAGLK